MSADASVRAARYGGGTKKSEFWKKVAASHAAGKANAALDQMKKINKHRTRIAHAVKKTFEDKKEGQMANWMDDDVRESVIDALIETELYEKKNWLGYAKPSKPARNPGRVSQALSKGAAKVRSAGSAAAGRGRAAGERVGGAITGSKAYQATSRAASSAAARGGAAVAGGKRRARVQGYLAKRSTRGTRDAVQAGTNFVKKHGTAKSMGSGVKDVFQGSKKLIGRSMGKSSRSPIAPVARKRAMAQIKRGGAGAGMAAGGAALATAGAYGAYRGGKALHRKYKNRKNQEESYTPREYYNAVVENLFDE